MRLTFFGVRGSYPVPDCRMNGIGGNSASIMVEKDGHAGFLDAGTGIISGGKCFQHMKKKNMTIPIFLTHLHIDHIQGLPFFAPVYDPAYTIHIYCPLEKEIDLERTVLSLFQPPFSPVTRDGIKARIHFHHMNTFQQSEALSIASVICVKYLWHPYHPLLGSAVYRLSCRTRSVVYATDIESPDGFDPQMADFVRGTDILIHDSQYCDRDYFGSADGRRGFGHSPVSAAAANARDCNVRKLYLFHYDPEYTDPELGGMLRQARKIFRNTYLARESHNIIIRS